MQERTTGEARVDRAKAGAARRAPVGDGPVRQAQDLQRAIGNRATGQVLARWTKHPDPEKKGVIVPDVVATEFSRFNPPKNA
jgi:hypothetical protein